MVEKKFNFILRLFAWCEESFKNNFCKVGLDNEPKTISFIGKVLFLYILDSLNHNKNTEKSKFLGLSIDC